MATFNLIRNSRVFFTTNVASGTGLVNATGFTAANTQELNVLDGFTFTQATNADTVTISEAGTTPSRGQRSFNTSLNPVDFSFSTYIKPASQDTVRAEESHLWNALLGTVALTDTGSLVTFTGTLAATISSATSTTPAKLTLSATTISVSGLAADDYVQIKGAIGAGANELNCAYKVESVAAGSIVLVFLTPPVTVTGTVTTNFPTTSGVFSIGKYSWYGNPAISADNSGTAGVNSVMANGSSGSPVSYAEISTFKSNANQLLSFGMLIVVDNITYAIDNAALDQASIDFGLDGIATVAWTGKATGLRQFATSMTFTTQATASGTISGTFSCSTSTTPTTVTFGTAQTLPAGTVLRYNGDIIGVLASAVSSATTGTLSANATRTLTTVTGVYAYTPTVIAGGVLGSTTVTGNVAAKFPSSNYITNKLSTATLVSGISGNASTSYTIALTGGNIQIANNINYITPANLGVINTPIGYYTGTRAISGTLNAYLRTGSNSTSALLSALLANASSVAGIEPKYRLAIQIGGISNLTRVEFLANGAMLQIPTIDAQAVLSTVINFNIEGFEGVTAANANFDLEAVNDMRLRYFSS